MKATAFVGCLLAALAAEAGTFVFTAPEGDIVPVLNAQCKAFLALPAEKLDATLVDRTYHKAFTKAGTRPCRVRFAWEYRPDRGETPPKKFIVSVRKVDTGRIVCKTDTEKSEVELENFEIAADYVLHVAVATHKGQELFAADRPFRTEDLPPRVLDVEGVKNFRDLGGWIGDGGKRVKQGLVFRSQGLNDNADYWSGYDAKGDKIEKPKKDWRVGKVRGTPESRRECLATLGIKTDLDLRRTTNETWGMTGSPLGSSVNWLLISSCAYGSIDKYGREAFVRDFRVFLDPNNYPILFHCIGGADRTGSLAYILNGLMGVSEEDLDRDYHFTAACPGYPWPMKKPDVTTCRLIGLKAAFAKYPGATMNARIYGFVRSCGITDAEIARLKAILFGECAVPVRDAYTTFVTAPSAERRQLMRDRKFRAALHALDKKWPAAADSVPRWYAEGPNLRDLGGWKTADGGRIRFGRLFRSAQIDDPKVRAATVRRLGVKTDLDLRKPEEAKPTPDLPTITVIANNYEETVKNPKWLRAAFDVLLDESKYPIIFHCASGADRTGTLAAVIELLLGVDEDDVAKDWQLTAVWINNPLFETIRYDRMMKALAQLKGDTWQAKAEAWVKTAGVTDAEIAKFRALLRE